MAAQETGALQEAKTKLEKQVEELIWRLQLEKRMRADLEEAKGQETAKLQSALQEMHAQVKEANDLLAKEREAATKAMEQIKPVIKETPVVVVDTAKLEILTKENEKLKDLVNSLEKKVDEAEKKYVESEKLSEERLKKAKEAERKVEQLKGSLQRLEEKLSNLELEDKVLRQQSLVKSPIKTFSESFITRVTQPMENGHHEPIEVTPVKDIPSDVPAIKEQAEIENKPPKPLHDRHENRDTHTYQVCLTSYWLQSRKACCCMHYIQVTFSLAVF